jgi:2-C-methyl-D-erythritol 4-phosphate cytidylyltransferase
MVSSSLILAVFQAAEKNGNCIPVVPFAESARQIVPGGSRVIDRRDYRIVQTPQVFPATIFKQAYEQPYRESFTDDATVVEAVGVQIHLIGGDPDNLKITHPQDLLFAEILMKNR